jgi:4-hydroxyphenylacetate 3-monooxygenase
VTAGRILAVERMPEFFQVIRWLAGASIIMAPAQADLENPELGPLMHRYFIGKDEKAPERIRMLKLAWDLTSDSFAARQLLFEMYNGGSLPEHKMRLATRYDVSPFIRMAKDMAGIEAE